MKKTKQTPKTKAIRLSKEEKDVLAMIVGSGPIEKETAGPKTLEALASLRQKGAVRLFSGEFRTTVEGAAYAERQGIAKPSTPSSVASVENLVSAATQKKRAEPDEPKKPRGQEIEGQPAAAVVRLLGTKEVDFPTAKRILEANDVSFSDRVVRNLLWRGRRFAAGKGKESWYLAKLPAKTTKALIRSGAEAS